MVERTSSIQPNTTASLSQPNLSTMCPRDALQRRDFTELMASPFIPPSAYWPLYARYNTTNVCFEWQRMHLIAGNGFPSSEPPSSICSCPGLENLSINIAFLKGCKEPILDALASRRLIKDFVVHNAYKSGNTTSQSLAYELFGRLLPKWNLLQTIELVNLPGRPVKTIEPIHKPITALNCQLRTIILNQFDLDEGELFGLLKSCQETVRTFQIRKPSKKLNRPGLCRVLTQCTSPDLESSMIEIDDFWDTSYTYGSTDTPNNPAKNGGLLDIVLRSSALNKLKSLSITGTLTGMDFFRLLPHLTVQILTTLSSWREQNSMRSDGLPRPHFDSPGGTGNNRRVRWLPNLKCFSVMFGRNWERADLITIREALAARGVCYHFQQGRQSWDEVWE
ncbi:hypothetical protein KEM48_003882 [Puccinia striiformis f. sp. tritici PST-130]|nr:hypothetical protein KEM48_003882 [Puccinia striiformis f. sp. tritici PST-130]